MCWIYCRLGIVYSDKAITMMWGDVKSMAPDTYITTPVIDAWCSHLNYLENYRSPESPSRLYITTYPCVSYLNCSYTQHSLFMVPELYCFYVI